MSASTRTKPTIRRKAVFTNVMNAASKQGSNLAALYPRVGFLDIPGESAPKPIYVGHPNSRCDLCERPFGKHEASGLVEGAVILCGDDLMTFTDVVAP